MRSNLPGHVIAVMFAAAATIMIFTIRGPIPAAYDVIKDFQPAAAAIVALLAASLAYFSAVKKVNFDRDVRRTDQTAARLALLIRLRSRAARLQRTVIVYAKEQKFNYWNFAASYPKEETDFEEAWQKLELIPADCMDPLETARYFIRLGQEAMKMVDIKPYHPDMSAEFWEGQQALGTKMAKMLRENCEIIAKNCTILDQRLEPHIIELRKALDAA